MAASAAAGPEKPNDECCICLERFNDPRLLPCNHVFCLKCIASSIGAKTPGRGEPICPLCRKVFAVPSNGVVDMPKYVGHLRAAAANLQEEPIQQPTGGGSGAAESASISRCSRCIRVSATVFCIECQQPHCARCFDEHDSSTTSRENRQQQQQTTVDACDAVATVAENADNIEDVVTSPKAPRRRHHPFACSKHREPESVKLFCVTCQTVVCMMCCKAGDHDGHAWSDVESVTNEFVATLTDDTARLTRVMSALDDRRAVVEEIRERFLEQVRQVDVAVRERIERRIAALETQRAKLLAELDEIKANRAKQIDTVEYKIVRQRCYVDGVLKSCNETLNVGTVVDVGRTNGYLRKYLARLTDVGFADEGIEELRGFGIGLSVAAGGADRGVDDDIVGRIIHAKELMAPTESVAKCGKTKVSESAVDTVKSLSPTLAGTIKGNDPVVAIALLDNRLFVSRSGIASVSVYDATSFDPAMPLTVDGWGLQLWGLAACSANSCLYVSDFSQDAVYRIGLPRWSLGSAAAPVSVVRWLVRGSPAGLSTTSAHTLLVACHGSMSVKELTTDGRLLRNVSQIGNTPRQAVELVETGFLAISVSGPSVHGLYGCYGAGPGKAAGQMNNPRGLAAAGDGIVLVADNNNNRIVAVHAGQSPAIGRPLELNAEPAMKCPYALVYDRSRRRLYVGECDGRKRLLIYDNVADFHALFYDTVPAGRVQS